MARARWLILLAVTCALAMTACGGDGDTDTVSDTGAVSATGTASDTSTAADTSTASDTGVAAVSGGEEADEGFGGDGHWTAGQLCTLADVATVSAMFSGVEVVERIVVDDATLSQCGWGDASIQWGTRAHQLLGVQSSDHRDQQLVDTVYKPIDVPGADPAAFAERTPGDERKSTLIAVVGDERLTVIFNADAAGGRDVAVLIATTWAAMQEP